MLPPHHFGPSMADLLRQMCLLHRILLSLISSARALTRLQTNPAG